MIINYKLMGSRISKRRKELYITQKKLSELIHVSNTHICSIERGEKAPSLETLVILSRQLNINVDYLLQGTVQTNIEDELIEKLRMCSVKNKKRISKIIDVFIEEETSY